MKIPEGVTIETNGKTVKVKGPKGELEHTFDINDFEVSVKDNEVIITAKKFNFQRMAEALITNMMKGVVTHFEEKLVIRFSHFPMNVEVKGNEIWIKNYLGERSIRKCKIDGQTKVNIKGKDITVSGSDKRAVGQTAANLRKITRVKGKDERRFEDGIYFSLDHW